MSFILGCYKVGKNRTKFHGKIEIPNLSEENTIEEVDVSVSCNSSSDEGDSIRKFMQTVGTSAIKEILAQYLKRLKEEYSKDLILPTKDSNPRNGSTTTQSAGANPLDSVRNGPAEYAPVIKDLCPKELTFTDEFFCTPDDLYKVLTTEQLVEAFTRAKATVEPSVGGRYSIFGGNVTGTFVALTPGKSFEMDWRKSSWPDGHHSRVFVELDTHDRGTRLRLSQTKVPSFDLESTLDGWKANFFEAVKQTYGYGGRYF